MNVAIVGGKTGGHLLPGVALAQKLKKRRSFCFLFMFFS